VQAELPTPVTVCDAPPACGGAVAVPVEDLLHPTTSAVTAMVSVAAMKFRCI
jgi:hypothetical protein